VSAEPIEREIVIEAPAEVVWGVITQPEQISRWFSDEASVEPRAGTDGTLTWTPGGRGGAVGSGPGLVVAIRVVEVERPHRFSFRWGHPEGVGPGAHNSALVEFILTAEAHGTRLRVIESGIEAVRHDDDGRARYREDHEQGWERHLREMLDYIASSAQGEAR
jgi:uncharacterized protein YndB with AHSA1/START domain